MFSCSVQLRKDPITRSWVITGDDVPETLPSAGGCQLCSDTPRSLPSISTAQGAQHGSWSARSVAHPAPLYRIEGDPERRADGIYDTMSPIGAHEVLVENPQHIRHLWHADGSEIEQLLWLAAKRIQDLKNDSRFRYISVFKNHGSAAGQEFEHPAMQLTATTFVPRRVLYELRASREYFAQKERCVFCDIIDQELRQDRRVVEMRGDFLALAPYAPRVPYETWIIPRPHESAFERSALHRPGSLLELGVLLRRTLQRIRTVTEDFHMVLHTSPNTLHHSKSLNYWKTIDDDYHWHIEILPILASRAKSYTFKEVYYSPVSSETAVKRLRDAAIEDH